MFILDVGCAAVPNLTMNEMIPQITSTLVTVIKIAVPILLIFFGMLDLGKAVMAQKEDEIKKGQQVFIKRLIAAAIVFFVVFIVQIVVGLLAPSKNANDANANIWNCVKCFIDGPSHCTQK